MLAYNSEQCKGTNWLFKDSSLWLLTTNNLYSNYVWAVNSIGMVSANNTASNVMGILPTLYLRSNVEFNEIGDGSDTNPYQLSL